MLILVAKYKNNHTRAREHRKPDVSHDYRTAGYSPACIIPMHSHMRNASPLHPFRALTHTHKRLQGACNAREEERERKRSNSKQQPAVVLTKNVAKGGDYGSVKNCN